MSVKALTDAQRASFSLLIIQTFSTLGFAVLYSTLVLYATKELGFSDVEATIIMGVFGAFNYGLHLLGGLLGGRLISNRNLFVIGMILQVAGCYGIAQYGHSGLYWGLALFLTGSGLNVTCINMMLTQRFHSDDPARESAFFYNYAGMNLGFFVGFAVAGYFQNLHDYKSLFMFATFGNLAAVIAAFAFWKNLSDLTTPLVSKSKQQWRSAFAVGILIIGVLVPTIKYLLESAVLSSQLVIVISVLVFCVLISLTLKHRHKAEQGRMVSYLILTLGSLIFWSLYQLAPMGLSLFADRNVTMVLGGVKIAPQWIQNINTVVIVVGGPLMATLFKQFRKRGLNIDIPTQFSASLIFIGVGFLALPVGIMFADERGMVSISWIVLSYVLQSIGELLISPVGYAMVGKLAPKRYQGGMMGAWMLVTGVASIIAAQFSEMMPAQGPAIETDAGYSHVFTGLGVAAVLGGFALVLLTPLLRRLIGNNIVQA